MVLTWSSGKADYSSEQSVRIRVIDGDYTFIHWSFGHPSPQSAISFFSETFNVPATQTREIKVQSDAVF